MTVPGDCIHAVIPFHHTAPLGFPTLGSRHSRHRHHACLLTVVAGSLVIRQYLSTMKGKPALPPSLSAQMRSRSPTEIIRSRRAIYFEEENTRCPIYLIEMEDRRLLCLIGQYLAQLVTPARRRFPSTEFTLVRYVTSPWLFTVRPAGEIYLPEIIRISFRQLAHAGLTFRDGEILLDWTYEKVKRALATKAA
ncbi:MULTISPECIES: hypothetical protein [Dyella]|uniref:Uncharacterized protein n=2 Tax=Dyella TaxID=231454 RepID=A0A4R0YTV8_9GAMM|nr:MULTISPECIES: hypothetical protein [Dyella]TBR40547.1 hypothetical protein EYV96_10460 [Dyella terrae]TCI11871.1 hypothetical protein EZM97_00410 [Dyella soli]